MPLWHVVPADFIPFGEMFGDNVAPPKDDSSFGPNMMTTPVVLLQNKETTYYVSYNN